MKTNYDHLIEGGIDALIGKNFSGADCGCCVCLVGEDCVYSGEECARAIKQWLEAEYIEPDTQERINEDAGKGPCEYFGHDDMSCSEGGECRAASSHDSCYTHQRLDLLRRQRELDGRKHELDANS